MSRGRHISYEQLVLGLPGTPVCPDRPTRESTLWCPGSRGLVLQVAKEAAVVQLALMPAGQTAGLGNVLWQPAEIWLPAFAVLQREFSAVRVCNYTPGVEAQVLVSVEK